MASVNKVILVGNLGRDPETRHAPSGDAVCNITVATTDRWRDKGSGDMRESTEWHRVVFWGKLAEIAGQYLKKGSQVYIEGRLQTRKWQDQSGQERYTTEIRAEQMQMLGRREGMGGADVGGGYSEEPRGWSGGGSGSGSGGGGSRGESSGRAPSAPAGKPQNDPFDSFGDDDIPF